MFSLQYPPFLGLNNSVHQNWILNWFISPHLLKQEEDKHRKLLLKGFGNSTYPFYYWKSSGKGYDKVQMLLYGLHDMHIS